MMKYCNCTSTLYELCKELQFLQKMDRGRTYVKISRHHIELIDLT